VRKAKGLSRAEVARSAGLTRRELAAYERGKVPIPESDLWCLAGSCGVDISELLPQRNGLHIGSDLGALTVGESVRRLRAGVTSDAVLREYLAMIYELRSLPPGTRPPMREEDLATLADALGGTPDAIEARLHELIGATREEAARLRGMILPPRSLPASPPALPGLDALTDAPPSAAAPVASEPPPFSAPSPAAPIGGEPGIPIASTERAPLTETPLPVAYPPPTFDFAAPAPSIGDPLAAERFFAAPRADDPFAPPPPLDALGHLGGLPPLEQPPAAGGLPPLDPSPSAEPAALAPPAGPLPPPVGPPIPLGVDPQFAPVDPFAPPSGPPIGAAPLSDPLAPASAFAQSASDLRAGLGFGFDPLFDDTSSTASLDGSIPPEGLWNAEMVVLEPGFDAADGPIANPPAPVQLDDGGDSDLAAAIPGGIDVDTGNAPQPSDPFAALRVPIPESGIVVDDPFGAPASTHSVEIADDPVVARDVDPFADAFTVPAEPEAVEASLEPAVETDTGEVAAAMVVEAGGDRGPSLLMGDGDPTDDDPTDDWFDRAAAATEALIARQRSANGDAGEDASSEPASVPLTATALGAAPRPDLPPIAWSLRPPALAGEAATTEEPQPTPEIGEAGVAAAVRHPKDPMVQDEFVVAGPDWQVGGVFPATAMADDGALALRRADVRFALADLEADDDFTVRTAVNFSSGAGFGILFRVSTDASERITGYSFDVDPIYSGGGFLVRQWNDSRQHWKPLAHAPVADSTRLYGAHTIEVSLRNDTLVARVDGEVVMTVEQLSRRSLDSGREPCRGRRVGVQAWSTTEVTIDRLMLANH
jgi:transcriptional regulator with XRE-family HTH domain